MEEFQVTDPSAFSIKSDDSDDNDDEQAPETPESPAAPDVGADGQASDDPSDQATTDDSNADVDTEPAAADTADAESETDAETDIDAETDAGVDSSAEEEIDADTEDQAAPELDADTDADADTHTDADTDAEAQADANAEPESEGETEAESESATEDDESEAAAASQSQDAGGQAQDQHETEEDQQEETEILEQTPSQFSAIIEASTLQDLLDPVIALVDEAKIHLHEDHVLIRAVDPANVGMVDESMPASAFESYDVDAGSIGVNLGRFEDIVSMASSDDMVQLWLDSKGKLKIRFDGLEYTLALIDTNTIRREPDLPALDLPAEVTIEGADLQRALKAADMVSDHIAIGVDAREETLSFEAEGDTDDINLTLDREDVVDMSVGEALSLFSLEYLNDMKKAIPRNGEVAMELGQEFPVKFHFELGDGDIDTTYMLAPRIQSD